MLQRFQSLSLLLAAAACFISLKLPFYSGFDKEMKPDELNATSDLLIMILTIAAGVLAAVTIFIFRDRKLQFLLCLAGIMLEGWILFLYFKESGTYQSGTYSLTSLLQPLIIIFFFLAARGVRKDMETIKDSERLR